LNPERQTADPESGRPLRLVVINHYAGTLQHGMVYRTAYLGAEWARAGHSVDVHAASWSHLRVRNPAPGQSGETLEPGLVYHWVPTMTYRGNGIGRVVSMLQFAVRMWIEGRRIAAQGVDAVILSTPQPLAIWSAHRIARLARAALVVEVRDLWPRTLIDIGRNSARHPFVRLLAFAERYACLHADLTVSLMPAAWPHFQALGVPADRYLVIPNGVAPDEWAEDSAPVAPDANLREALEAIDGLRRQGRTVVGYFGAQGLANALDTLIDAASRLRDQPVGFVLIGHGPFRDALRERARVAGLSAISFIDPVPKSQVATAMRACDLLYVGAHVSPLYQFGVSFNKLFDYLCAGKPIVLAADIADDAVTASGAGQVVAPDDPSAVASAILELASMTPTERQSLGQAGRRWVLANHAYPILARRYILAIRRAIANRRTG
jgi:glycosyltransferase involved in cell wall biosynthesis